MCFISISHNFTQSFILISAHTIHIMRSTVAVITSKVSLSFKCYFLSQPFCLFVMMSIAEIVHEDKTFWHLNWDKTSVVSSFILCFISISHNFTQSFILIPAHTIHMIGSTVAVITSKVSLSFTCYFCHRTLFVCDDECCWNCSWRQSIWHLYWDKTSVVS